MLAQYRQDKSTSILHGFKIECLKNSQVIVSAENLPRLMHLWAQPDSYRYLSEKLSELKVIYTHAGLPHRQGIILCIMDVHC